MIDLSRGVLIAGAGALLLSWMATAGTDRTLPASPPPQPPAQDPAVRDLNLQTERLRSRVAPAPRPVTSSRNPFRFAESPRPASPAPARATPGDRAAAGLADPAAPDPMRLIGLAEDRGPDGLQRTAIISVPGDLLLVKVGDTVLDRYRVEAIGPEGVDLRESDGAAALHLRLR